MKKIIVLSVLMIGSVMGFAQTATMNTTGNWDDATKWASSNIGDAVTESITISNNVSPTVRNGFTYTVGNTTLSQNNTLTVDPTGTLNIGNASNSRTLTTNNNANISVAGVLIIWGNVIVNNNINWAISGTVIIKGNLTMVNNANVVVSGNLTIDGNFVGGMNTNVNVSGQVNVGGNVSVGSGNLNGCTTCFTSGGTCTGPSNFCNKVLPVVMISFTATSVTSGVKLAWVTSREENFDYFLLERAGEDLNFKPITTIHGTGGLDITSSYYFLDREPLNGKNYYRLKNVDFDLAYEYSDVVYAAWSYGNQKSDVVIYPNPIADRSFTLEVNHEITSGANMTLLNSMGKQIIRQPITSTKELVTLQNDLKPGAYYLKVTGTDFNKTIKVFIQ